MDEQKEISIRARTTDPETSHEAAASFEQDKAAKSVRTVIQILEEKGELTDFQIRSLWSEYWGGPFSDSLPCKARHWAREQGFVRHVGYGKHNKRRVRKWGLGKDDITMPIECPCCGVKTRNKDAIAKIQENVGMMQKELI